MERGADSELFTFCRVSGISGQSRAAKKRIQTALNLEGNRPFNSAGRSFALWYRLLCFVHVNKWSGQVAGLLDDCCTFLVASRDGDLLVGLLEIYRMKQLQGELKNNYIDDNLVIAIIPAQAIASGGEIK